MVLQVWLIKESNDQAAGGISNYNFEDFESSPCRNLKMGSDHLSLNRNRLAIFHVLDAAQRSPVFVAERKVPEQVFDGSDSMIPEYFSALVIDHRRGFNSGGELQCVQIINLSADAP